MSGRRARLARLEAAGSPTPGRDPLAHCLHLIGQEAQAGPLAQIGADLGAGRLTAAQVFERVRLLFQHDAHAFAVYRLMVSA
ncbi:hypothetical protein [Deinococcus sp. UYEF24]